MADLGTYYVNIAAATGGLGKAIEADLDGSGAGRSFGGNFLDSIRNIAIGSAVGNLITTGLKMAADGARQIFSEAFSGFADYQQLEGGMQKLYGDASDRMMELAQQAYATSGLSANQYMEQATSFSAALINSLGGDTAAAAELTDVAMRAMSDNVNTFGTDMDTVSAAFRNFSRGNYAMLDSLALGYAGTKSGMEQLIADANEYARSQGLAGDMVIDSFADQIRAIELIQEKQGIAGTTAAEAAGTVSGSLAMLSASWTNFLGGLGNGSADMGALTQQLVGSLASAASNVVPLVIQIGRSAISAIPSVISEAFGAVVAVLDEQTGGAISGILESIDAIIAPLREQVWPVIQDVFGRITAVVQTLGPVLSNIADGAMRILAGAAEAIGWAFDALSPTISFVADLFGGALKLALDVVSGLFQALADAIEFLGELIAPVADFIVGEFEMVAERLEPIIDGIGGIIGGIGDFLSDPLGAIGDFVTGGSDDMRELERNADRSTQQMQQEVTRNCQDMVRVSTNSTDGMTRDVISSTRTMASTAGSNMGAFVGTIDSTMSTAAATTAEKTGAMQASIDGLEGRDVEVNTVTNDYRGITEDVQERLRGIVDRTVNIFTQTHNPSKGTLFGSAAGVINQLLSIQWGAKGGFLDGATLIGAGEAGTEALIPLSNSRYMRPFVNAMAEEMDTADYYDKRTYELLVEYAPAILQAIPNLNRRDFDRLTRRA